MIETFRGIWRFAGKEQRNIRRSVIACFFNAVFHMFEIAAIYYTILALLNKRVAIGQRMKSVPMGYFNDNSLGELTGVCTTVLDNVETVAPMVLVTMLGGMLNALVHSSLFVHHLGHGAKIRRPRPAPSEVRGQVGGGGAGVCAGHERGEVLQPHRTG